MAIEVVAILTPAEGKSDRVIELLNAHAEYVKENEPSTTKYHLHKQVGSEDLVMIETYNDQAALAAHGKDEKFKAFGKKMKDEGLLGKPMQVLVLNAVGGFASKL